MTEVRRNDLEREQARKLRADGYSLRQIASELDVSLSSASVWVRDIDRSLPEEPPTPRLEENAAQKHEPVKRCPRCEQVLPENAFNRYREGRQGWCRECFRAYFRDRGDLHRRQSGAAQKRRQRTARIYVGEYLDAHKCVDCGEADPAVLEFDHVGPRRKYISELMHDGASPAVIENELQACEVVCANCHRRRTARRANWRRATTDWWRTSPPARRGYARNLAYLYSILELGECVDCGVQDMCVLEFDHVSEKTAPVTQMARDGVALKRLKAEADRCELRCVNCHRRRTLRTLGITRCAV